MGSSQNGMESIKYNHGQRRKKSFFSNRKERILKGKPAIFLYKNIALVKNSFKLTKERKALMLRKGRVQAFIFLASIAAIATIVYLLLT